MKEPKHFVEFSKSKVTMSGLFAWCFYLSTIGAFIEGVQWLIKDAQWIWNWLLN